MEEDADEDADEDEDDRKTFVTLRAQSVAGGKSVKSVKSTATARSGRSAKSSATHATQASRGTTKSKRTEQSFGREFKAKRAGGDARYKGAKMDPFAYVPLDPRALNRRNRAGGAERFAGMGRGKKRGYRKRTRAEAEG